MKRVLKSGWAFRPAHIIQNNRKGYPMKEIYQDAPLDIIGDEDEDEDIPCTD